MALWQYDFHFLPCQSVLKLQPNLDFQKDEEDLFDDSVFWLDADLNAEAFDGIEKILPKGKSWSNQINMFGHQEGNLVEVSHTNNKVYSMSFRIDFTSNYKPVLENIIEFCLLNNLIVIDEELNILLLNFETLDACIQNSTRVVKYNSLLRGLPPR